VDWYLPLKLVHVVSAIVAVGANLTYLVWLAAMRARPAGEQAFALETVQRLDMRLANPAYGILPITGIVMVLIAGGLGFTTFWVAFAIGLYIVVGIMAGAFFAPSLRRQAALAASGDVGTPTYEAAAKRTRSTGILTMLPIAGILYLMVLKPTP
jgi:uncharacterized membrane protein